MVDLLSIVMPCYNEQDAIPTVISRTLNCLDGLKKQRTIKEYELIVVDDQSTDGSLRKLEGFTGLKIVKTGGGERGYGKALKAGFRATKGEWIGFFDIDNSYRPEDITLFIEEINKGESDFIMGQRRFSENGMSVTRGFGNWVYVVLAKLFFGSSLDDVCSGYRFFHRRHLADVISISEQGLNFSIQLTLKMIKKKTNIKPLSIQYDRRIGSSKLSVLFDGISFLKVLLAMKFRSDGAVKHS